MKVIINIPEDIYKFVCQLSCEDSYHYDDVVLTSVKNGTPIPDNATVGEVFCMLACKEPICETASYFTIDKNLWNAPYQKGGK